MMSLFNQIVVLLFSSKYDFSPLKREWGVNSVNL